MNPSARRALFDDAKIIDTHWAGVSAERGASGSAAHQVVKARTSELPLQLTGPAH